MSMPLGEVERVNEPSLEALATALANPIKSKQAIAALSRQLLKLTVETALKAELDEHLAYERYGGRTRDTAIKPNRAAYLIGKVCMTALPSVATSPPGVRSKAGLPKRHRGEFPRMDRTGSSTARR